MPPPMLLSRRDPTMGLRPVRRTLLLALVVILGACAVPARNPFAPAGTEETQVFLQVENRGFNDIRLYALSSRGPRSLGSVEGNTIRRMTLDWRTLDHLSFRIEVLAGRTYNTHTVSASPGDRVDMVIPDDPSNTFLRVR